MSPVAPARSVPEKVWRACWFLTVAGIFAWGAIIRFRLPQWPLLSPDSGYFLYPTINGGIYAIGPRTFVYPLFCRMILNATQDWHAIVFIQHLLGLTGPALLLCAWVRLGIAVSNSAFTRIAHDIAGLAILWLLVPSAVYI